MVLLFDVNNLTFTDTLLISLFSMLVVFFVLLCISYLVDITAFFVNRKSKKKNKDELGDGAGSSGQSLKKEVKAEAASPSSQTSRRADARTLAIIMAAIKAYEQDGQTLSVRKIVRSGQVLSGWEQASIQGAALRRSR
ncbi:MAG: hypothetical protein GX939_00765 [Clostridiaceae bacterium]|jgi:Na+-transporting methylmalonyl-CoA/oxaloacetate decarboxylase gamma subunit|nr:hypothetical protein [Clostridiaceae bacterium]